MASEILESVWIFLLNDMPASLGLMCREPCKQTKTYTKNVAGSRTLGADCVNLYLVDIRSFCL